ncbi:uncharacterized protein LAESUDRAFT_284879 [Laetiporus sulphureus 93-53]|uniref:Peptidase C14 caspase domain-containing protein n=1 Tax=Laetiporus sulphureus 93-53 TaxID=1314785 RepID=A0A165DG03_9APHY|nr:uncharacterized protein LAESUDRAFT_284879 [Laetiporus sulphureus 93-53]KZT04809.1 hypothetical protein LAESUDRAFT_284879 [Laetiporus sulphureus 93-53]
MQIFAVIIGINDYLCEEPLHGATGDAKKIAEFLKISLQVPKENMIVLLDGDAIRDEILKSLHSHLRDNVRIHYGDAIIIYFAGHGTIYETHVREPMEAIMPIDSGFELPDGTHVVDISDRQINLFLQELYDAKGGNITVVTDCCYSAGSTRDRSSPHNFTARSRPSLQLTHQTSSTPPKRTSGSGGVPGLRLTPYTNRIRNHTCCLRRVVPTRRLLKTKREARSRGYYCKYCIPVPSTPSPTKCSRIT